MKKITVYRAILPAMILIAAASFAYGQGGAPALRRLIVFHSPQCHRCIETKNNIMPGIEKKFAGKILVEYLDIENVENYKLLLGLEKSLGMSISSALPVFYFEGSLLSGEGKIGDRLTLFISRSLKLKAKETHGALPSIDLIARFKSFEPIAVVSAGLLDGINPCAFTVIVFFISFLAFQGYRKRELIAIGLMFIAAVFLTYLLIGVGIFGFLYRLKNFWLVARIFNVGIGIFCV
ncbi:MAG: hypothetical protein ACM3IL_01400, partial [Deltaproteobacteria bacterium]